LIQYLIMPPQLLELLAARQGHFRFESGHHGKMWLDLDHLFQHPNTVQPLASDLAARLAAYNLDALCGPLVGGALLAQMIASELKAEFFYTERLVSAGSAPQVKYHLPKSVRHLVQNKKIAIVDDVINAGSAVHGTLNELQMNGAQIVVISALLVLGNAAQEFCNAQKITLESLNYLPNDLWLPEACPLCATQVPLEII
jgi:orotate phosphoribosyltransferase